MDPTRLASLPQNGLVNPSHDFSDVANSIIIKIHTDSEGDDV